MSDQTATTLAWGLSLQTTYCKQCDWRYLQPVDFAPRPCPHCFQANLSVVDESKNGSAPPPPELYLPFTASNESLTQNIERFAKGIWFAPGDLKAATLKTRLQRLYLPMWLVDGQVEATWQAETGFDYDAISHRDNFDQKQGGWTSQEITETRIRWEARVGRLRRTYHNVPAPALEEHFTLIKKLGQFNQRNSRPYQARAMGQALIRLPNRSTTDAWPDAVPAYQAAAAEECQTAAQADHLRGFRWSTHYHHKNWTLLLLPTFVTYYLDDDKQPQPVLIHGQTGQFSAPRRASMKRARMVALIIVAVAAVIFTISLILGAASLIAPPLLLFAALGAILAVLVGMMAVAPLIIAWQTNRTQKAASHR